MDQEDGLFVSLLGDAEKIVVAFAIEICMARVHPRVIDGLERVKDHDDQQNMDGSKKLSQSVKRRERRVEGCGIWFH